MKKLLKKIYVTLCALISFFAFQSSVADAAALVKPANNLGLVGYWSFNDATSTKATDFSGNGNTGTLTNMANPATATSGWGNGKLGGGLNFDGTNDYVDLGSTSMLPTDTSAFSVSWWAMNTVDGAYTTHFRLKGAGGAEFLFAQGGTGLAGLTAYFGFRGYSDRSTNSSLSSQTATLNRWVHRTIVFAGGTINSPANWTYYENGIPVSLSTFGTVGGSGAENVLGANTSVANPFTGKMDEFRIYRRALSVSEITSLYNTGAQKFKTGVSNNGLVGYWSFNDATSTIATDFSGNGNNGTLTNMATPATATSGWGTGKLGGGLNFDGTNDYVNIPDANSLDVTGAVSISFWLNTTTIAASALFEKRESSNSNIVYGCFINDSGATNKARCYVKSLLGGDYVDTTTSINTGTWKHVVFTHDGSATAKIYVDGVLNNTATISPASSGNAASLTLGSRGGSSAFSNMKLDEIRIYNRALSATEIQNLYNSGAQKINSSRNVTGSSLDTGLVGLWSFDGKDMSGTTAYDRSGQGNNGTLTNGPVPTIGKMGQALSFDGVNDYVNLSENSNYAMPAGVGTISVWFKTSASYAGGTGYFWTDYGGGTASIAALGITTDNKIYAFLRDLSAHSISVSAQGSAVNDNTWHHVVMVRDSLTTLKTYLDGTLIGSASNPSMDTSLGTGSASVPSIGKRSGNSDSYFTGSMDEVRFYSRGLTASEVTALYNLGK